MNKLMNEQEIVVRHVFESVEEKGVKIGYLAKPIKCLWCSKKSKVVSMALIPQKKAVCLDCFMTTRE